MVTTELFLTVEQAARRLKVHPITVRRHLRSGLLRGVKRGHLWRVPESALGEQTVALMPENSAQNAFARALDLVAQLEKELESAPLRQSGESDVIADLRAVREAQTP